MDKISVREVIQIKGKERVQHSDHITIEEPLEIRLSYKGKNGNHVKKSIAVTMRTPGDDEALAAGFLFTEGVIQEIGDIERIEYPDTNIIFLHLKSTCQFDPVILERNFYTSSSCGVCGKASIESIHIDTRNLPWMSKMNLNSKILKGLSEIFNKHQSTFNQTGGIHAAALFNEEGMITRMAEDVGRHNAMDKLIGSQSHFPIHDHLVMVSGRASFELVQKAAMAGIPILVAVGAPSSLAIDLAEENGMTLIGFLKDDRYNIYSGEDRIHSTF